MFEITFLIVQMQKQLVMPQMLSEGRTKTTKLIYLLNFKKNRQKDNHEKHNKDTPIQILVWLKQAETSHACLSASKLTRYDLLWFLMV